MDKSVFVVFFAGERARTKILKLCEAVGANRYPFPEERSRQRQMNAEVNARLRELHVTLEAGTRQVQKKSVAPSNSYATLSANSQWDSCGELTKYGILWLGNWK